MMNFSNCLALGLCWISIGCSADTPINFVESQNQESSESALPADSAAAEGIVPLKAISIQTEDWNQFLGPHRDGVYRGEYKRSDWDSSVPERLWSLDAGDGFAGPVVAQDRVYLFHRIEGEERVDCLDFATGKLIWKSGYPAEYRDDFGFDPGPRSAPTVDISLGVLVSLGANGDLQCLDLTTGERRWKVQTRKDFGADKGFFGMVSSPLIWKDLAILNIGGASGNGVVAFDLKSGTKRWSQTSDEAGYSSPILVSWEDKETVFSWTREALVALEPGSGKILARYPFRSRMSASVNAATPLHVAQNRIFLTASYATGAVLLNWDGSEKLETIWASDDKLSSHYATPVQSGSRLFGYHGRQEYGPELRCIDWTTGEVIWKRNRFGAGSVLRWNDEILALDERGTLWALSAVADEFKVLGRVQISGSESRAMPALSKGVVVARDNKNLVAWKIGER